MPLASDANNARFGGNLVVVGVQENTCRAPRSGEGLPPAETVKFGQDFEVGKVLYQKVRSLSEGRYRIFWERRSCTKKCEKTLQMVRLCTAREDPDQI